MPFLAAVTPAYERAPSSGFARGEAYASLAARVHATRADDDSFGLTAARVPSLLLLGAALGAVLPVVGVVLANCARSLGAANLVASRVGLGVAGVGVLGVGALATAGLARAVGAAVTPPAFHLGPPAAVVVGAVDLFMLVLAAAAGAAAPAAAASAGLSPSSRRRLPVTPPPASGIAAGATPAPPPSSARYSSGAGQYNAPASPSPLGAPRARPPAPSA